MSWIRDIVTGLVECYGTNDTFELCDCLNISIVEQTLKNQSSLFYRNQLGDEFIFIDPNVNQIDKKTIIAHELGHAILHPGINIACYDNCLIAQCKWERQANIFASELLMFDSDEHNYLYDGQTLSGLAECLEVSECVVECKYKNSIL